MSPSGVGGVGGGKVKVGSGGPASVKDQLLPVSSQPLLGRILDWERGPDQSEDDSGSGASLLRPSLMPSAGPRLCRPCTGHTGHTGSYFSELKMNVASWGGCGHRQVTPGIWEAMKAGLRQNSAKTDGVGIGGHGNSRRNPSLWFMGRTRTPLSCRPVICLP